MVRKMAMAATAAVALMFGAANASASTVDYLDLTTTGTSGYINNAFFEQIHPSSTGTGVIQSFLRVQKSGTEEGFNTDYTPPPLDDKSGNFTHSLLLSDVPVTAIGQTAYRQFLLDVNQLGSGPLISLDSLKFYVASTGNLSSLSGATKVWDMAGGENPNEYILLDSRLNAGSGSGDMFAYIPESVFTGANQFVYLYSKFGVHNATNDGFEEWSVVRNPIAIPLPPALAQGLVGMGGMGLVLAARRFRRQQGA